MQLYPCNLLAESGATGISYVSQSVGGLGVCCLDVLLDIHQDLLSEAQVLWMGTTGEHRSTLLRAPLCSHDGGVTSRDQAQVTLFPRQDGESFAGALEDFVPHPQRLQCPKNKLCEKECVNVKGDEK